MNFKSETPSIVLLGCRVDGSFPVMEIANPSPRSTPYELGAAFLANHLSCASVELWVENHKLATVARAPLPLYGSILHTDGPAD